MKYTIGQLVQWILSNRRDRAFQLYDEIRVGAEIVDCIRSGGLLYSTNINDQLDGVCCGKVIDGEFMVYDVLTTQKGVAKKLAQQFVERYGHMRIVGLCRGRYRSFNNPITLFNRLKES